MTRKQAIKMLGIEVASQAATIGEEWGKQEVELYLDQNEGKELSNWTMGEYAEFLPTLTVEEADAYRLLIDCAAKDVWNSACGGSIPTAGFVYGDVFLCFERKFKHASSQSKKN